MSHYIYFKRKGGDPIVVQDVATGNKQRTKSVYIDGPSEIIWDEQNPDLDVSVYCLTDSPIRLSNI